MSNFVSNDNATSLFTKVGQKNADLLASIGLPAGAGKNLLPLTESVVKAATATSGEGTWSGNTYTHNGISFACSYNENGYLESVSISGTASNTAFMRLCQIDFGTNYLSTDTAQFSDTDGVHTISGGANVSTSVRVDYAGNSHKSTMIRVNNGTTIAAGSPVVVYPMIRPAGTSPDYVPYSESMVEMMPVFKVGTLETTDGTIYEEVISITPERNGMLIATVTWNSGKPTGLAFAIGNGAISEDNTFFNGSRAYFIIMCVRANLTYHLYSKIEPSTGVKEIDYIFI